MATKIYIIIPVHNRKNITLKCLDLLKNQGVMAKYNIIVVDDGSTDGTSTAIKQLYPEVILLYGDGNLWWTGAIRLGMEYAYNQQTDYFIWLNDDTFPAEGAIDQLILACQKQPKQIVSATCYETEEFVTATYGGHQKQGVSFKSNYNTSNAIIEVDAVTGNLVCLPHSIINDIGFPDDRKFPHNTGDLIYTWQAKKYGYKILSSGGIKAVCKYNNSEDNWLIGDNSILAIWLSIFSPKSYFYVFSRWHQCIMFAGWKGLFIFFKPYLQLLRNTILRLLFPQSFLKHFKHKFNKL